MVTSVARGDSAQQTIRINEVGGLPCAGCARHFSVGFIGHAACGPVVCDGPSLEESVIFPMIDL